MLLILSTAGSVLAMFLVLSHRNVGWEAVAAELLLVFVLGLEGIIAYGAFFREESVSAGQRQQLTVGLLEKFTSAEANIARAETWRIRHKWFQGDKSCVKFFVQTDELVNSPDEEARCANGLTPHQNLSWLLHFYVSVQAYEEAGLLDGKLAATLLAPHYQWYRRFFQEFCEEYRKQKSAPEVEPAWLNSLPKLETIFKDSGSARTQRSGGG
ncbi:MAG TPA: hypothetical protein VKU01_05680 [Bryobacteraceae bacterium]|nr:hypothetical protein [Bryobacteraceae bacterium]